MISERQNLVVIGAGIAGLATAYFYKRRFPERDLLVLQRNGEGAAGSSRELDGESRVARASNSTEPYLCHVGLVDSKSPIHEGPNQTGRFLNCRPSPRAAAAGIASQNLPQRKERVFTVDYISRSTSGTVAVAARLLVDADRSRNNAGNHIMPAITS